MDELRYANSLKMEVSLRLSRQDRVLGNRNRVMGGSYHMLGGLFSRASFEGIFFFSHFYVFFGDTNVPPVDRYVEKMVISIFDAQSFRNE